MKQSVKILVAFTILACVAFTTPKAERKVFTVVIDAAHGGKDFGAVHEGLKEKEIVRKITKKITALNNNTDVVFHVINEDDAFLDLQERVKAINSIKADLVISLHVNAGKGGERSGMEFFVGESSQKSKELAIRLSRKFEKQSFKTEVKSAKMLLVNKSEAPSIIFEMGYLTNNEDMLYLTSEEGQSKIADVVIKFINEIK